MNHKTLETLIQNCFTAMGDQINVTDALNKSIAKFIIENFLPPIANHYRDRGSNVTVEDLTKIIDMTYVTVSTNSPPISAKSSPGGPGPTSSTSRSTPAPKAPRKRTKAADGSTETCIHPLDRSPTPGPCGKPAHAYSYCKTCLKKVKVKTALNTKYSLSADDIAKLINDPPRKSGDTDSQSSSTNVSTSTPSSQEQLVNEQEFVPINEGAHYLHVPTSFIGTRAGKEFTVIAKHDNGQAKPLENDDNLLATQNGFRVHGAAPPIPPATTPVSAAPQPSILPPPILPQPSRSTGPPPFLPGSPIANFVKPISPIMPAGIVNQ